MRGLPKVNLAYRGNASPLFNYCNDIIISCVLFLKNNILKT